MDCPLCGRTDALEPVSAPREAAQYPRRHRAPDALSGRWVQLDNGHGGQLVGPVGAQYYLFQPVNAEGRRYVNAYLVELPALQRVSTYASYKQLKQCEKARATTGS